MERERERFEGRVKHTPLLELRGQHLNKASFRHGFPRLELEYPAQRPDLNPTEHLRNELELRLHLGPP